MTPKTELKLAYWLAAILLVVGVSSYAAFPAKAPEQPVRLMLQGAAGNVLFTHKIHTADSGYGISCNDCHHHPEDDDTARACGVCHVSGDDAQPPDEVCAECHDSGSVDSGEVIKRMDSFHTQCIGCHKEKGSGPEECAMCHVM